MLHREQEGLVCNRVTKSERVLYIKKRLLALNWSLIYPDLMYCDFVWASTVQNTAAAETICW